MSNQTTGTQPEPNAERELRLGILNAFSMFAHRVACAADHCSDRATRAQLVEARKAADVELYAALMSHPANQAAQEAGQ